ncbi:DUF5666 domain-containing protein [uncultured Helicobacter sp.]|uniref:DUF5666 domain-containing protein n=1 Tax=uncultured Helicobacter sp. TaxID=175537 RepID=UPI002602088B|nr:DUF5666 domain-containing protein [uncultured Helicobacter sp.]
MLKQILASAILALSLSPLFADSDIEIQGQITKINDAQKTISLSNANGEVVIQVFPHTELKGDDCGTFGNDTQEKFTALKTGMFVEVEALPQANGGLGAKSIEWKCGAKAY